MTMLRVFLCSVVLCLIATTGHSQACYDFSVLQRETLGRGVVAVRADGERVCVTWRYLSTDALTTAFAVYRSGEKVAYVPADQGTFCYDNYNGSAAAIYKVVPVIDGAEQVALAQTYTLPANAPIGYIDIPVNKPADGVTPTGEPYSYTANDASVGDVDGDGEYEIILKWDPTNSHDNSQDGYTGNVYVDCYRLSGEQLWRIDLGRNIRAGAHYTQMIVYDLDGDGRAEIVMKTADGTVDGIGQVIGDATADYREAGDMIDPAVGDLPHRDHRQRPPGAAPHLQGRVMSGNEYLTVFSGLTGEALATVDYTPPRGEIAAWGDNYANRVDRFLATVAYLDGVHPSVVMCRGYYTRMVLAAYDWDGTALASRWVFDTDTPGNASYAGQGNHNLRVGDVDGDGCDEIIYGACAINNDGTGLHTTGFEHGDALHLTQFAVDMPGLQVWDCHENKIDGSSFRDANTGEVLFQLPYNDDVGRCMAADIDPTNWGLEMWSSRSEGIRNIHGEVINDDMRGLSINMAVWWDGDLLRELLDGTTISKYDWTTGHAVPLVTFDGVASNNGTKANPCLQGDIVGDWREEVLLRTTDSSSLRLYISTLPTDYRFHTFLEDPVYRISLATENIGYNQPTQPGFYFGPDLNDTLFRGCYINNK